MASRSVSKPAQAFCGCRACRKDVSLMAGTVMERGHTPVSTWYWAAYLIASQTPGMSSAVQFQRQLGLSRYETAFGILHKLRAGMVRPERDKIGGKPQEHVEVDETWVGGRTPEASITRFSSPAPWRCGAASREPSSTIGKTVAMRGVFVSLSSLTVAPIRSADSSRTPLLPDHLIVTDDWSGYAGLRKRGFDHHAIAECGDPEIAEEFLPIIHLVFANLKTWINGIHHGDSVKHLQAYLNEFMFRFNRRFYPFNAFRSLLGIAGEAAAPTFDGLFSGEWVHPTFSGCG
ncbi:IS1595 family transposase [Hoeflea sp.]|uniref:IS1595 family transposase n=1 Tax=Hoeflea sp. TaxID=1940281 RepID=UPI0031B5BE01